MTIRSALENHLQGINKFISKNRNDLELKEKRLSSPNPDTQKEIKRLKLIISNKEKEVSALERLLSYDFPNQLLEKEVSWLKGTTKKQKSNIAVFGSRMRTAIRSELPFDEWEHAVRTINKCFSAPEIKKEWFTNKENSTVKSKILKTEKIFERNEIYIKMLKLLQGGTNPEDSETRTDIGEYFSISREAVDKYLKELQYGLDNDPENKLNILGKEVQVEEFIRGKNLYDHTIHPIFLTLNLSEIAFITIGLKKLAKEHCFYSRKADDIADDVYHQLSDYAKEKIKVHPDFKEVSFSESSPESYRSENRDLLYYQKLGLRCWIECSAWEGAKYGALSCYDERNDTIEFYMSDGNGIPVILNCHDDQIKITIDK